MSKTFSTDRNAMLDAMVCVLGQINGVELVQRAELEESMLSDKNLPAILVTEGLTEYVPETRHARIRTYRVISTITLDVQVRTLMVKGEQDSQASMVREAMVEEIIDTLLNNPTLKCTPKGQDEPQEYCHDAVFGRFRVTYPAADSGYANALITHQVLQFVTYDNRKRSVWQKLISTFFKWTNNDRPTPNEPQPIELDI